MAISKIVQDSINGGVAGSGPAFSAYFSGTLSPSSATWTKLQFQTEEFDTANCFDNATNFRFTPNVAGYYQVSSAFQNNSTCAACIGIYKNGSLFKQGTSIQASAVYNAPSVSCLIYLNGTTDYIESYCILGAAGAINAQQPTTYFQAVLVRSA